MAETARAGKVNYLHAALLLHSAGKAIDEAGLAKVVEATGVEPDKAQIKALVANLEGVNIDEAVASVASAGPASPPEKVEAKKEKKEEKAAEEKQEEAVAGLSALFG